MAIYGECCYGRCPNFTTEISKCDKVMDTVINRILIFWSNTNIIGKHAQYQSRLSGRLDVWVPNNVNILCVLSTDDWLADYLLTIPSPRERVLCMCGTCHMSHDMCHWHTGSVLPGNNLPFHLLSISSNFPLGRGCCFTFRRYCILHDFHHMAQITQGYQAIILPLCVSPSNRLNV